MSADRTKGSDACPLCDRRDAHAHITETTLPHGVTQVKGRTIPLTRRERRARKP